VHICFGKNCTPAGSQAVFAAFERELAANGLSSEVELIATSCRARCEVGPSVNVYPGPVMYGNIHEAEVTAIVRKHLVLGGSPVLELVVTEDDLAAARKIRRLAPG